MSSYCTESDIRMYFGSANVTKWADIDVDGSAEKIAARIADSIAVASADIDSMIRRRGRALPAVPYDVALVDAARKLAGVALYEGRGLEDNADGEPFHRYSRVKSDALRKIAAIAEGLLEVGLTVDTVDAPQVIASSAIAVDVDDPFRVGSATFGD